MKVTFLGTGTSQGVPVIACTCPVCRSIDFKDKRLRSSIHLQTNSTSIIIDIGPDFRQQVLRENIPLLDAILLTHEHKDHTAGLDDVRSYNFKQNKDMPVYGRKEVLQQLQTEFGYIFSDIKYPGVPSVDLKEITNNKFSIDGLIIEPVEVMHYKLPVFGFKIGDFAYVTDAKTISETEKSKLKGLDVLVLNALQKEAHISHLTLSEAIELIKELEPKKTYLTHISHNLGLSRDILPTLPDNVHLAYDGLKFEV
ncbi:MAG: MBL fold metallo-hydrolase [Bacteroidetes bacterium]|nr:MAG: MBL fold metallo-hydrolase [Bacteroidota bacterium]